LAGLALFYIACGGSDDPEKSETDVQIEKLNGSWKASSVTFEGGAPQLDHSNLVLAISGTTGNTQVSYTVSGRPAGPSAWPSSGTFAFGSNVKQNLTREDNVSFSYSVTDTKLTVDFNFNATPYTAGRAESVAGDWHFEFDKQ
jgi:hypothetical protein